MAKKWWKRIGLFIAMLIFMFALLGLRAENEHERDFTKLRLPKNSQVSYVVDIGKEGSLKYFVQPNVYTVYFRLQPQDKNAQLMCRSEGLTMLLSQGSKKGIWQQVAPSQVLKKEKGVLPLSAELYVPRDNVKQYAVGKGTIKFFQGDELYAVILVEVVNSRYKE